MANRFWVIKGEYRDPSDPNAKSIEVYMSLSSQGEVHWHNSVSSGNKFSTRTHADAVLEKQAVFGDPREIFDPVVIEVNLHSTGRP